MSDWRDQLQPASWRGVPCQCDPDYGMRFGRRVFSAEYPYRDDPFTDDMGRKQRSFSLPLFILDNGDGNDLFAQRTAMLDALEAYGPGTLIHPRFGTLRLQVSDCDWRAKNNVERFMVEFLEAGEDAQPQTTDNTIDTVVVTAAAAIQAQQSRFAGVMQLADQASHVVDAARDQINRGMQGIRQLVRIGTAVGDDVASLTQTIDMAINDVSNLIMLPLSIATNVASLVSQALNLDGRLDTVLIGYRAINTLWGDAEPVPQTTPSRIAQAQNQAAIAQLFTATATIEAARQVADLADNISVTSNAESPFASADEAIAVRDELVAALDVIAQQSDDAGYAAIVDLQTALVSHIAAHGNTLPRVRRLAFGNTMPLLTIAYRDAGNLGNYDDLIARNRVRHPLFIRAGTELEVLHG